MLRVSVWLPATVIGVVAGVLTVIAACCWATNNWGKRVEVCGGLVLYIIGLKILLEHTILK
jgi:putative Mn2+ efflux pump MntP